ncbi:hypothetical protein M427DRAFT_487517 [Gonapodya prolifera JEL478]|uniref:Uncharacterized protein n=1 Tax=Gonapodya prolifera (strain JEL478) TaxID=1344416 RepID=A0A139A077_GONPJ|nr:hypothetical protein M427DRAFT_487517 [Gonapodya prolifera JEL478]|eukprot:KXS10124.1 hypothetical protein M427DRAFT_487517 [Gonapodya prolifera JEL478]
MGDDAALPTMTRLREVEQQRALDRRRQIAYLEATLDALHRKAHAISALVAEAAVFGDMMTPAAPDTRRFSTHGVLSATASATASTPAPAAYARDLRAATADAARATKTLSSAKAVADTRSLPRPPARRPDPLGPAPVVSSTQGEEYSRQVYGRRKSIHGRADYYRHGIDVVFVMECTYHMVAWLAQLKSLLEPCIHAIHARVRGAVVRVAFIGYTRVGQPQTVLDFTQPADLPRLLALVTPEPAPESDPDRDPATATAAADAAAGEHPTAIVQALAHAPRLAWQATTRSLVHIVRAGTRLGRSGSAPHPDPDPEPVLRDLVAKAIDMHVVRVHTGGGTGGAGGSGSRSGAPPPPPVGDGFEALFARVVRALTIRDGGAVGLTLHSLGPGEGAGRLRDVVVDAVASSHGRAIAK